MGHKGIGDLCLPENAFWHLVHKEGFERNPFKYWCSPNEATPDYVASHNLKDFVGYGFVTCWDALDPQYFTMWNMVEYDHLQWLREAFISVFELVVLGIYDRTINEETDGKNDFDHGQWSESINIGNHDDEPHDEEEVMYAWYPGPLDEESFSLVMSLTVLYGEGGGGDDEVIWIRYDAIKDRQATWDMIKEARKLNNLKGNPCQEKYWKKAIRQQGKKIKSAYALCDREAVAV